MEEEVASDIYGALIDYFGDDFIHTNLPTNTAPIFLPEEPMQVQCFPPHQHENGPNHKSVTDMKPGKIAAYLQQQRRPWLTQNPSGDQANSGKEEAKKKPKLQPPAIKKDSTVATLYQEVMEEVASKTRGAFLKHYGDDSAHVQFQELWKLKMKNKEVKLGCLGGNFPPAGVKAPLRNLNPPYERRKECGTRTSTQEKDPWLTPWQTTTSIPLRGESVLFQGFPAYNDSDGTNSISAASVKLGKTCSYKQQPSRPWQRNAGFEEAKPKKTKLRHPAKVGSITDCVFSEAATASTLVETKAS